MTSWDRWIQTPNCRLLDHHEACTNPACECACHDAGVREPRRPTLPALTLHAEA